MPQKEKELLLADLCSRLPYGIIAHNSFGDFDVEITGIVGVESADISCTYISVKEYIDSEDNIECIKPYLRPMSSMTEKEMEELQKEHLKDEKLFIECINKSKTGDNSMRGKVITHFAADWCHRNHFDYCGLIEKGLAIEAPEDMYQVN